MRKILTPLFIALVLALLSSFAKPPASGDTKAEIPPIHLSALN